MFLSKKVLIMIVKTSRNSRISGAISLLGIRLIICNVGKSDRSVALHCEKKELTDINKDLPMHRLKNMYAFFHK